MPWNNISPNGLLSVKANKVPMQQNTAYIRDTMGASAVGTNTASTRDHFWNVGANEDGRHRFVQSPQYTSTAGLPAPDDVNPILGTGMDGVLYLREVNADVGKIQGFFRNIDGIYQYIPTYITGTILINSTSVYSVLATIPPNCYGEVILWVDDTAAEKAFFVSSATDTDGYSLVSRLASGSSYTDSTYLTFANGSDSTNLQLKAKKRSSSTGNATWNYRITYRAKNQDG